MCWKLKMKKEGPGPQQLDANVVTEPDLEPLISGNALTGVANFLGGLLYHFRS